MPQMTYKEELESPEWRYKRKEILERDNFCCQKCSIKRTPFLGLSQKFGIKSFKEMIDEGYSFNEWDKNTGVKFLKNSVQFTAKFIDEKDKTLKVELLNFAQRWKEPVNKFVFGSYELICFTKNITINDRFPDLNVHHKYYIEKRKAWEYDNKVLITLCENCHKVEHEINSTKVFNENGEFLYIPEICGRCQGSGYLREFNYYHNGICFNCFGNGIILPI